MHTSLNTSTSNYTDLLKRITEFVDRHDLCPPNSTIIVGLSGGADSVFLLHFLLALRESRQLTIIAAHLNHGWRAEAEQDARFCKELAAHCNVPFHLGHARDYADRIPRTGSREEHGRLMRRLFFETLAQQQPDPHRVRIALAHHRDDQHETFFIRLIRGAGIQGLKGMVPRAQTYIRPLLCVHKHELIVYLAQHNLPFVIDASNESDEFLRNRIRHHVMPALQQCDERAAHSLDHAMRHLAEADEFLVALAQATLTQITAKQESGDRMDLRQFFALQPFLQRYVLIEWLKRSHAPFVASQGFLEEILRFLRQPAGGTHALASSWRIHKKQSRAAIITSPSRP